MKDLVDILDLTKPEIYELVLTAKDMIANPEKYAEAARGRILGTLFFEPSTRTRLSFTSAMMSLGGDVLGISEVSSSSVTKGETLSDTIRMVSAYTDIIAMRHPNEGAATVAARVSTVPVINAGDGGHHHPTQTLTDLLTINRLKGRFNKLTIGICGDLKYGRTVHSLIAAMSRYEDIRFVLIAPEELKLPEHVKSDYLDGKCKYTEVTDLTAEMDKLDVLYMTRVQEERFASKEEYERLKDVYILTPDKLANAKADLAIMHPLPRVNEIAVEIDDDPRAAYFEQAANGRYIRMALILKLLTDKNRTSNLPAGKEDKSLTCNNPHCVTKTERGIKSLFNQGRCIYCEHPAEKV